eukprot:jgi/Psemu1/294475/fgenesh1_pm.21_\
MSTSVIRELVVACNRKGLNALLGCESRKSRVEVGSTYSQVAPSTPKACVLVSLLRSNLSKGTKERRGEQKYPLTVEHILQALLMVDPSYITPWNALEEFSSTLPYYSGSILPILQCTSSIEDFLLNIQFSVVAPGSQAGQADLPRCIRESMVLFVKKLGTQYGTRDTVFDKLISELIQTVATVCKSLCSDLFETIVATLHFQKPSPARMKTWLQLVKLSQPMLSVEHAEKIRRIIFDLFCDISIKTTLERDAPSMVAIAVQMASPNRAVMTDKKSSDHVYKIWRKSLYLVLYQILINQSDQCYIDTEKQLTKGMKKWIPESLKNWIAEIIDDYSPATISPNNQTIPSWFLCNLLSLCTHGLRTENESSGSELVDMIMNHNLESKCVENQLSVPEYQSMLNFLFGNEGNSFSEHQLDEVYYRIGGFFHAEGDGGIKIDAFSTCGVLVLRMLRMKKNGPDTSRDSLKSNALSASLLPRAMRLVNMADDIAKKCIDDQYVSRASVFATIAKTVVYFEVPESRSTLELKTKQGISEQSRLQHSYLYTIHLIAASAQKMGNDDAMIDRWSQIIDSILPFSHGAYTGCMFAALPRAQARILSRSKKLLAPLYSKWGSHTDEMRIYEKDSEPKAQQRFIDGMRGLLEIVRNDRWKNNEVQAWAILSDSLVEDLPPLPFESRQWLLDSLAASVTNGIFSTETLHHLLRATTTRIASYFMHGDTMSHCKFRKPKEMEEIKALHRFVTILFRSLASANEYSESRHILLAQGREAFIRSILSYKKGQTSQNQFHNGILEKLNSMKARHVDSFSVCYLLFLKVNHFLLDYSLREKCKPKINEGYFVEEDTCTSFVEFINEIKEIEDRELHIKVGNCPDHKSLFPFWLSAGLRCGLRLDTELSMAPNETSNFIPHLLDILVEFLFSVPLPTRESHDFNDPLPWKVISATGFLTSQGHLSAVSIETIKETAEPFLSISSLLVRKALRLDCALSVLEDLLVPTVSYCRSLHLTLEKAEPPDCTRIVGSLWNLYQAVASEKACIKIIHYLESHISENDDVSFKHDDGTFSLSSIQSESDVDETVQKLRLSCLRPFLSCLSHMSNSDENNSSVSQGLIGGILGALAKDLRAGLNGNSGGLPQELYITYCILIEECASILFSQRLPSFDCSIFLLFKEVGSTLANILTTIPLRDAVLFRTTYILAAAVFPSMCRDLTRRSLCYSYSSAAMVDDEMFWVHPTVFDEVLNDCLGILNRWAALREPYLIPWLDIAGPDHSGVENNEIIIRDDKSDLGKPSKVPFGRTQARDGEIPRFVHVPSPSRNRRNSDPSPCTKRRWIRLQTKEVWSWALSCSLLGLEQKWLESERTIQASDPIKNHGPCEESSADLKKFFRARKMELRKSLVDMNRFFHTSPGLAQRDQHGNRVVLDVVAMNLPSAPRSRFCCLVECVSRVLIHSIRHLCSFWSSEAGGATPDLSVFESMCCVSAWLSLGEDPDDDFSVGLFKWLAIVSRKRPPGESAGRNKNSDASELYERVSTVSEHVHRLYLALEGVPKSIRSLDNRRSSSSSSSEWMEMFYERGDPADEMLRFASRKLQWLQQVMPREFLAKPFPDFPSSETDPPVQGRKRTRLDSKTTKPRSKATAKPKRMRRTNRNKVVDIFMDLDRGTDSPRRNSPRDAYADLEDFLVEG